MRKVLVLCFVLVLSAFAKEQVKKRTDFQPPLNIPLNLAGNFGEFRSNHFHTGIDIKTQGRQGLPVMTIADGYVSRIKISPYGYGNAVYIDHPNGYTSVYAHLSELDSLIDHFVTEAQYEFETFWIDLHPNPKALVYKSGEVIGKSGNSGSSGGPHLHFEIRHTATEFPVNPLLWDFPIEDHLAPMIYELSLYPQSDSSTISDAHHVQRFKTSKQSGICSLINKQAIEVGGPVVFGLHTLDFLDNNSNRCGIYEMIVSIDDSLFYEQRIDELSFESNRMMNAHLDYKSFKKEKKGIHRAFRMPYNELPIYKNIKGNGSFIPDVGVTHDVTLETKDVHGNLSSLSFKITGVQSSRKVEEFNDEQASKKMFNYNQVNTFRTEKCNLFIPENRLYGDVRMKVEELDSSFSAYSGRFEVGNPLVPVHDYFLVKIKLNEVPDSLGDKLVGVSYLPSKKSKYAVGGDLKMGWLTLRIKRFGQFYVDIDTIAPSIRNADPLKQLKRGQKFSLKVTDDLSGVNKYDAYLNGSWLRMKYDAKRNHMWVDLSEGKLKESDGNELLIVVFDERDNKAEKKFKF